MIKVKEIQKVISDLSPQEFVEFRVWFEKFNETHGDKKYHRYVVHKINKGLKQIKQGNGIDHQEVKKRLGKWISK